MHFLIYNYIYIDSTEVVNKFVGIGGILRDGNFAPPRFDPPLPASPRAGFPRAAKVVGWKWDEILDPHPEVRRGWVYTF